MRTALPRSQPPALSRRAAPLPSLPSQPAAELPDSLLEKLGLLPLCVFLFLAFSRVTDFVLTFLHLPLITSLMALGAAILCGGIQRAFSSKAGKLLVVFTLWLFFITPFGYWRGGSITVLKDYWIKSLLVFFLIAGLIRTIRHCRRVMLALAMAGLTVALISLLFGSRVESRLVLSSGSLANSNAIAFLILMLAPFWGIIAWGNRVSSLPRIIAGLAVLPMLGAVMMTGSRAALVSLSVLGITVFLFASLANRLKLLLVFVLLGSLVALVVPHALVDRYRTTLGGEDDPWANEAVASKTQRLSLLKDSIAMTFRHPILGVGPGNYQAAAAANAKDRGTAAAWRETHNTYTQVSSETGIPGFLLFVSILFISLRETVQLYKRLRLRPDLSNLAGMAFCLLASLLSFCVGALFGSGAYEMYAPALAGLTAGFAAVARRALQSQSVPVTAPSRPDLPLSGIARRPLPA